MNDFRISILIRTFNSARSLERTISRLGITEDDQLIVVDSGSTDSTLEIAGKHHATVVLARGPFSYSKSLNLGFRAANHPWVLVVSSHLIPLSSNLLGIYRDEIPRFAPDVVVGYGPVTVTGKNDLGLDPVRSAVFGKDARPEGLPACGNANAMYRRSIWEISPFDEQIRTGEDTLWIRDILSRGYRFCYIPKAAAKNRYIESLYYMFAKGFRDAKAIRPPDHRPMSLWHLGGAGKKLLKLYFSKEIDFGDVARGFAHACGAFAGARAKQGNAPLPLR